MATTQINARLSSDVKREGDATLARFGSNATEAIRSLWTYLGSAKELPDFMKPDADAATNVTPSSDRMNEGAGLALRLAHEKGLVVTDIDDLSYQDLRDYAFEELMEEGAAHA